MKYQGQTEINFEITRQDSIINLVITGRAYFSSGVYYGENSFPDDYDSEIISAVDEDGKDYMDELTSAERDRILDAIDRDVQDQYDSNLDY